MHLRVILGMLLVGVAVAGCGSQPFELSTSTADGAPAEPSEATSEAPNASFDLELAVAPYDAHSQADTQFAMAHLEGEFIRALNSCIAQSGVTPFFDAPAELDRDLTVSSARASFPDVVSLRAEGIPLEIDLEATLDAEPPPSPSSEYLEVETHCLADPKVEHQRQLLSEFTALRDAWEVVLADLETDERILQARAAFAACLQSEGIPHERTGSEHAFLGWLDEQRSQADSPADAKAYGETWGKLYADCGDELFTIREQLREGPQRDAFLTEHEDRISQLADSL